jgi:hypothetical protein
MAIKHLFADIVGTTLNFFRIGKTGPRLENDNGSLHVRNTGDTADVRVTASEFNASSDVGLVINSDASSSGSDWKITLQRPATGMTADVVLTLPPDDGSAGQVLQTDGNGVLSWVSAGSTAQCLTLDTTTVNFGDTSPITLFTLPANAIIDHVDVIVDTAFDGTPSLTVGIAGDTAKYMGAGDNLLTEVAVWRTHPGIAADVASEALIATYSAGGATVGSARVVVAYAVPA